MIKFAKENKLYCLVVAFLLFFFIFSIWTGAGLDNDFFHLVASGRWMWENKAIMYENEYFVLDGYQTVIQQWLYCILLYLSWDIGNEVGVYLFVTVQFFLLFFVEYKFLELNRVDKRTSVFIIMASMLIMSYVNCRPEMISLILLYSELIILERYKQFGKRKGLYLLPVLMLLEMNLHCTFWVFHFVFILPYIVPANKLTKGKLKVKDTTVKIQPLVIPMLLMIISLFVNPYGIDGILCLFYTKNLSLLNVLELSAPSLLSVHFLYLVCDFVLILKLYKKGKLSSTAMWFAVGTGAMCFMCKRNALFLSVGIVYLIVDWLKEQNLDKFYVFFNKVSKKDQRILSVSLSALLVLFILDRTAFSSGEKTDYGTSFCPVEALTYIKDNEEDVSSVKMFTSFNTGAWFACNGIGGIYMESKTEPYMKGINKQKDIISEYAYIRLYATKDDIESFLAEYDFDYLYVSAECNGLQVYLEFSSDYECVVTSTLTLDAGYDEDIYDIREYRLYKHIR